MTQFWKFAIEGVEVNVFVVFYLGACRQKLPSQVERDRGCWQLKQVPTSRPHHSKLKYGWQNYTMHCTIIRGNAWRQDYLHCIVQLAATFCWQQHSSVDFSSVDPLHMGRDVYYTLVQHNDFWRLVQNTRSCGFDMDLTNKRRQETGKHGGRWGESK